MQRDEQKAKAIREALIAAKSQGKKFDELLAYEQEIREAKKMGISGKEIHLVLKKNGLTASLDTLRRFMQKRGIVQKTKRKK